MERQKPTFMDKLRSERGEISLQKVLLFGAIAGLIAVDICADYDINKLEDRLDALNTPTPTPAAGIDTFENFTNSDPQLVFTK